MISASNIISIAAGQIGTTEKPINKVKYNDWFYDREVSGTAYPWCMAFVMWVFFKAGASSLIYGGRKSAYCPTVMQWFKANGKLYKDPHPGDVVFYNFSGGHTAVHTGIVEHVGIGTITAIEGNTSSGSAGSQTNGGMVARRIRNRSCCLGFGRPSYAATAKTAVPAAINPQETTTRVLKQKDNGPDVKRMQEMLIVCGYSCGPAGADGVFGTGTFVALCAFQKASGIAVDGIYGPKSAKALETAYAQRKARKSVDTIAREVIAGKWGSGRDRIDRLEKAGYDATQIQHRVNELLRR